MVLVVYLASMALDLMAQMVIHCPIAAAIQLVDLLLRSLNCECIAPTVCLAQPLEHLKTRSSIACIDAIFDWLSQLPTLDSLPFADQLVLSVVASLAVSSDLG